MKGKLHWFIKKNHRYTFKGQFLVKGSFSIYFFDDFFTLTTDYFLEGAEHPQLPLYSGWLLGISCGPWGLML